MDRLKEWAEPWLHRQVDCYLWMIRPLLNLFHAHTGGGAVLPGELDLELKALDLIWPKSSFEMRFFCSKFCQQAICFSYHQDCRCNLKLLLWLVCNHPDQSNHHREALCLCSVFSHSDNLHIYPSDYSITNAQGKIKRPLNQIRHVKLSDSHCPNQTLHRRAPHEHHFTRGSTLARFRQ